MRSKWRWLAGAAVVTLALIPAARLLWLSRDGPHFGFYHDDGVYWVTAKSIAQSGGYRIPSLPGNPAQTKYPPVYPALLAFAWKITPEFPANLGTAVWLSWLPLPAIILLTNALLGGWGIRGSTRALVCAAVALNPYLAYFGTILMSENWATLFLLAALVLAGHKGKAWWHATLCGLCAAAAYLTKTMLAPALIAIPLAFLWRREKRAAAAFFAAALPPVVVWHLWSATHHAAATDTTWLYYLDYFGHYRSDVTLALLPTFIYQNLGALFSSGGDLLFFRFSTLTAGEHLARLVMIAALAGVVRWARASRQIEYPLFAAIQFALFLPFNGRPNERFLLPALPLLVFGLWIELSHLGRLGLAAWRRPDVPHRVAAALVGIVLFCFAAALLTRNLHATWSALPALAAGRREAAKRTLPLYAWIRDNTPHDATFFADRDTTLYLRTGRRATFMRGLARFFYTEDRAAILAESARLPDFVFARRLDYVLLTPADFELEPLPEEQQHAARDAIARDTRFRAVYDSRAGTVLEVKRHAK